MHASLFCMYHYEELDWSPSVLQHPSFEDAIVYPQVIWFCLFLNKVNSLLTRPLRTSWGRAMCQPRDEHSSHTGLHLNSTPTLEAGLVTVILQMMKPRPSKRLRNCSTSRSHLWEPSHSGSHVPWQSLRTPSPTFSITMEHRLNPVLKRSESFKETPEMLLLHTHTWYALVFRWDTSSPGVKIWQEFVPLCWLYERRTWIRGWQTMYSLRLQC